MKSLLRYVPAFLASLAILGAAKPAMAKTDGLLLLGTQAEVRHLLRGTPVEVNFSEEKPNAIVAVRLTRGELSVYEQGAVQDIVKFVGKVVHGGVVITLKAGSALWDLLDDVAHCTVQVGEAALKAACWVLAHAKCLVVDGVTLGLKTAAEILEVVADFLQCIFH